MVDTDALIEAPFASTIEAGKVFHGSMHDIEILTDNIFDFTLYYYTVYINKYD